MLGNNSITLNIQLRQQGSKWFAESSEDEALIVRTAQMLVRQKFAQLGNLMKSSKDVKDYLHLHMASLKREVFAAMLLDNKHRLIKFEKLFIGTVNQATVSFREVAKFALQHDATAVIVVHNHPSGDALPSNDDIRLTSELELCLSFVGIKLLDHFIVGGDYVVSMQSLGGWHEASLII